MVAPIFTFPVLQAFDDEGNPLEAAQLTFFDSNTSNPADVYSDVALTTPILQPIVADNAGRFVKIYLQNDYSYRVRLEDQFGAAVFDVNDVDTPETLNFNLSGNFVIFNGAIYPTRYVNVQTGPVYIVQTNDWGKLIIFDYANPVTVTLDSPLPTTFPDGWFCNIMNIGAGSVTLTSTANINGSASDIIFSQGQGGGIACDGTDYWSDNWVEDVTKVIYPQGANLVIASGEITVTHSKHVVDTEGGAGSDDLDTILGMVNGQRLVLSLFDANHNITVKTGTGNIVNPNGLDITLDTLEDFIEFEYDSNLGKAIVVGYGVSGQPVFSKYYESTQIAFANQATFTHGLGGIPKDFGVWLHCITADGNWAAGDEVKLPFNTYSGGAGGGTNGSHVGASATTIYFTTSSNSLTDRTTGATFNINTANWTLIGRAWK